jgi:hypothetical protein
VLFVTKCTENSFLIVGVDRCHSFALGTASEFDASGQSFVESADVHTVKSGPLYQDLLDLPDLVRTE